MKSTSDISLSQSASTLDMDSMIGVNEEEVGQKDY